MRALQLLNAAIHQQRTIRRLCLNSNGFLCLAKHQKQVGQIHTSIKGTPKNIPEQYQNTTFKSVYYFPYIRHVRLLSRLKLYQTAFTVIAVPAVSVMYSLGLSDQKTVTLTIGVATFAGLMLYVMSGLFRRCVGIIAIDEDASVVRFSHLTFWGNRLDEYVPIQDVVPLGDYCTNYKDIYIPIKTYSSQDVLYMSLYLGQILDRELFEKIFGDISYLGR